MEWPQVLRSDHMKPDVCAWLNFAHRAFLVVVYEMR